MGLKAFALSVMESNSGEKCQKVVRDRRFHCGEQHTHTQTNRARPGQADGKKIHFLIK